MDEREVTELLPLQPERPPLRVDAGGAVRVGNSRISLDLIVEQYENGMTPDDMILRLRYLALGRCLRRNRLLSAAQRRSADLLKRRREEADSLRAKIEAEPAHLARRPARPPQHGILVKPVDATHS